MGKHDESSYTKGFVFGALIGASVGAIAALLLAPKSGAELRKDLAEKSKEAYDKASNLVGDLEYSITTNVGSTLNEGRMKAEEIVTTAKQQAENLISDADSILRDARYKASQFKDATKAGIETFKSELKS